MDADGDENVDLLGLLPDLRLHGLLARTSCGCGFPGYLLRRCYLGLVRTLLRGRACPIRSLTLASGSVTIPLFLLWGVAQVGLGLFIGAIFKGERTATLVSYLMMFLSIVLAYPMNIWRAYSL